MNSSKIHTCNARKQSPGTILDDCEYLKLLRTVADLLIETTKYMGDFHYLLYVNDETEDFPEFAPLYNEAHDMIRLLDEIL